MASDRLPGVGSEASTADVSVVVGNSALAWETRNDQSAPTSLTWAVVSTEPAEVGRGLGQGGVVGIGGRADHGQQVSVDDVPGRGRHAGRLERRLLRGPVDGLARFDLAHLHRDLVAVDGVVERA